MYVCMRERERERERERKRERDRDRENRCVYRYIHVCVWVHARLIESTIIPVISQPAVGDFTFGDKGLLS